SRARMRGWTAPVRHKVYHTKRQSTARRVRVLNRIIFCFLLNLFLLKSQVLNLRLDHINIAVADLNMAIDEFEKIGFVIKKGRLHQNSILNAFIKFNNHAEIELITASEATDDLSAFYVDFIRKNAPGKATFLCLEVENIDPLETRLKQLDIDYLRSNSGYADFITFPENSEFNPVFFIGYTIPTKNTEQIKFQNTSTGIQAVWISESLKALFENLGFAQYERVKHDILGNAEKLDLVNCSLIFSNKVKDRFAGLTLKHNSVNQNERINLPYNFTLEFSND
ncbi:MAG: VOC family protein, partial [Calditrichaeota bacterium]|nr:VOC family protein [Calditrichota bacterium]